MSTITREFTKEQLIEHAKKHIAHDVWLKDKFAETHNTPATVELARIALASLEADPVYFVEIEDGQDINAGRIEGKNRPDLSLLPDGINHLYAAPPAPANAEPVAWLWSHRKHPSEVTLVRPEDDERAEGAHWSGWSCQALYAEPSSPVSVPDELSREEYKRRFMEEDSFDDTFRGGWSACRAAMLQGADGNSPVIPDCSCRTCRPITLTDMRFVVCPECGNKRCPHANDHRNACTGSNEPGQEGSAYPAAPQQEA